MRTKIGANGTITRVDIQPGVTALIQGLDIKQHAMRQHHNQKYERLGMSRRWGGVCEERTRGPLFNDLSKTR
jgi:hypothetical protein